VALGRPSVTLFGATDPLKWGAQGDRHRTVHKEMPCAPCCIFGYRKPCRSVACMQSITVADVLTACRQVL
jgi:ADP-heptose:LPS heptosyltransferase